jgi:ornithine carrier protein
MVSSMVKAAPLFLAYSAFQNVIRTFSSSSTTERLTIPQLGLAAGGAGFLTSFVLFVCFSSFFFGLVFGWLIFFCLRFCFLFFFFFDYRTPIELVKSKMQVQMMNFHPVKPAPAVPGRIPQRAVPILPSSLSPASSSYIPSSTEQAHTHTHTASHVSHSSKLQTAPPTLITTERLSMHDLAHKSGAVIEGTAAAALRPPGPIALIRSIVISYGVRGLWLGHTGTLVRETGSTAAWFVVKEYVARKLVEQRVRQDPSYSSGATNTELLAWESAASGAIAGAVGVLMFYPADTVKSAVQTEDELRPRGVGRNAGRSSFVGTFRKMWVRHGVRGLYAGCGMTVARVVPSSAIIFMAYDGLTAYFA